MRINNNLMAMNTHRQLGMANTGGAKSMEKLSSGLRINRAGDDAAGLAISEKMRGQIRGLNQASSNAQDGISLIQTAEGALNETHAILQRMRELAVQSSTDTNTDADRMNIQDEMDELSEEITRISTTTEFNTMKLLDGSFEDKKFHIGANEQQNVSLNIKDMSAMSKELGLTTTKNELHKATAAGGLTLSVDKGAKGVEVTFAKGAAGSGTSVDVSESGNLTVNYDETAKTGTSLKDLQEALKSHGVNIEATSTANTIDLTATGLDKSKVTLGNFNQAKATTMGGATITNSKIKDMEVVVDPNQAKSEAILGNDGRLTITLGADATDINKALTDPDNINKFLADQGIEGVEFDAVAVAGEALDLQFTTSTEGTAREVTGSINVSTQEHANTAITTVNSALENVSKQRSKLGAIQNRLEHTIKNLDASSENLQASEARIRDVDMAKEMMEQTKQNILQQASTAMLAQANQAPQTVLSLLR